MTTKITVEKISADEVRVTLVADIRITGNLIPAVPGGRAVVKVFPLFRLGLRGE